MFNEPRKKVENQTCNINLGEAGVREASGLSHCVCRFLHPQPGASCQLVPIESPAVSQAVISRNHRWDGGRQQEEWVRCTLNASYCQPCNPYPHALAWYPGFSHHMARVHTLVCVCVLTQLGWGQGSAALHQGLGAEIPMEAGEGRACKIGDS